MSNYIQNSREIAVHSYDDAQKIAEILLRNENVVMISREENLFIINFVYSKDSDRNNVAFMERDVLWEEFIEKAGDEEDVD